MIVRFYTPDSRFILRDDEAGTVHYFEVGTPDYDLLAPIAMPYVPSPPDLKAARADALASMVRDVDIAARSLSGDVPETERLSWTSKEVAARAMVAGIASQSDCRMLQLEASSSGQDVLDLAHKIIKNADAYRDFIATATGSRRAAAAKINTAETIDEIGAAFDEFALSINSMAHDIDGASGSTPDQVDALFENAARL